MVRLHEFSISHLTEKLYPGNNCTYRSLFNCVLLYGLFYSYSYNEVIRINFPRSSIRNAGVDLNWQLTDVTFDVAIQQYSRHIVESRYSMLYTLYGIFVG